MGSGGEGGDEVDVLLVTEADSHADSSSVVHGEGMDAESGKRVREGNCDTARTGVCDRECDISEVRACLDTDAGESVVIGTKSEED